SSGGMLATAGPVKEAKTWAGLHTSEPLVSLVMGSIEPFECGARLSLGRKDLCELHGIVVTVHFHQPLPGGFGFPVIAGHAVNERQGPQAVPLLRFTGGSRERVLIPALSEHRKRQVRACAHSLRRKV